MSLSGQVGGWVQGDTEARLPFTFVCAGRASLTALPWLRPPSLPPCRMSSLLHVAVIVVSTREGWWSVREKSSLQWA